MCPKYEVGKQWWFPSLNRKPDAGEVIELPEEVANDLMRNEPGLLKPVRMTAQARPKAARGRGRPRSK